MRYTTTTTTLIFSLLTLGALSSPAPNPDAGGDQPERLISIGEQKLENGATLEWLGPEPPTKTQGSRTATRATLVQRDCSAHPTPSCSTSHTANNELCSNLVNQLYSTSRNTVPESPRQVCYKDGDDSCCTSWHNAIGGLDQGDLADGAKTILNQCVTAGVSGKIYGIKIGGACTDQCLSDRGNGC
ncbi:hypothetical protein F4778DRAFT_784011 [Xylariomycetidae sp. FL2044]|nr:hypothetical protein F4778DRAFT_784011 [Xylariomycetidae sp. FL2044]